MAEPAFAVESGIAPSLYSCALAALSAVLPEHSTTPEASFLRSHAAIVDHHGSFREAVDAAMDSPEVSGVPLALLARALPLQAAEALAVTLAAAVETDLMFGRAIAHLQAPLGGSRPTLGLLAAAFAELDPENNIIECLLSGRAVETGLLQLFQETAPAAERAVSVPIPLCLALAGRDTAWPGASMGSGDAPPTPLPASIIAEAKRQARALSGGLQRALVIRSGSAAESRAVAREIAGGLDRRALFLEMERGGAPGKHAANLAGLGPLVVLRRLVPAFCFDLGPSERGSLPSTPGYSGPALALCGHEGAIEAFGESPPAWTIAVPAPAERRKLWNIAIGEGDLAARLAVEYRHGSGRIAELGRRVRQRCVLEGRERPQFSDIADSSWTGNGSALEGLAQPLPDRIPDEALVAGPILKQELSRLLVRCRSRENLVEGLGASAVARYRPGVRALFTGPSGTGKTLAASWLGTQLGLPLYRADLASVTSKYIGETEKNLAHLLARAEDAGILLLFDEADSLFGKRTEVKESNDRFANAQTNYLLQRIETFDGIALLTSNSRGRFDPAFCRRLDMIVEFPLPGPEERRLLWLSHLGTRHQLSARELNRIAAAADLAGGHIRNVVLTAAALARSSGRPIAYDDVYVGLTDEYRKLGRQAPSELVREE